MACWSAIFWLLNSAAACLFLMSWWSPIAPWFSDPEQRFVDPARPTNLVFGTSAIVTTRNIIHTNRIERQLNPATSKWQQKRKEAGRRHRPCACEWKKGWFHLVCHPTQSRPNASTRFLFGLLAGTCKLCRRAILPWQSRCNCPGVPSPSECSLLQISAS